MASSTLVKRKSPRISVKNIIRMSFGRGNSSKPDMGSGFFCDAGDVTAITAFCGGEDGTMFNEHNSSQTKINDDKKLTSTSEKRTR